MADIIASNPQVRGRGRAEETSSNMQANSWNLVVFWVTRETEGCPRRKCSASWEDGGAHLCLESLACVVCRGCLHCRLGAQCLWRLPDVSPTFRRSRMFGCRECLHSTRCPQRCEGLETERLKSPKCPECAQCLDFPAYVCQSMVFKVFQCCRGSQACLR